MADIVVKKGFTSIIELYREKWLVYRSISIAGVTIVK